MQVSDALSYFFYGKSCLGCGGGVSNRDPWLCPKCHSELREYGERPLWPTDTDTLCLYPMTPLVRRLVLAMKYGGTRQLASYLVANSSLGRQGEAWQVFQSWGQKLTFLPVPVHSARMRERGYNQCDRIAHSFAEFCGGKARTDILFRRLYRESQTWLGKGNRELNVAGAFNAKSTPTENFIPVVVDDVYTTGATTSACVRALEKSGISRAKVCTLIYELPVAVTVDWLADSKMGCWE